MAKRKAAAAVNREGLTQAEWLAACGPVPIMDLRKLTAEWEAGVDPSDWRAHYGNVDASRGASVALGRDASFTVHAASTALERFGAAYKAGLLAAVIADPDGYGDLAGTARGRETEYAAYVADRMLGRIAAGEHRSINYDSGGFKRACKALGIKCTRKAIFEFLGVA